MLMNQLRSKTPIPSVTYKAKWLHSEGVVTVDNCQQHRDWPASGSVVTITNSDYTVTVQSLCLVGDWWKKSFAAYFLLQSDLILRISS